MKGFPNHECSIDLENPTPAENTEVKGETSVLFKLETAEELERKRKQDSTQTVRRLKEFLQDEGENIEEYLLPPKTLLRYAVLMDIVSPDSRRSVCFTKGYGHYAEGTGSVLQVSDVELESIFRSLNHINDEEKLNQLLRLKLRYFTPREIANLMGFPHNFSFPSNISVKQQYRVLGNSLNVHVVAELIRLLVS